MSKTDVRVRRRMTNRESRWHRVPVDRIWPHGLTKAAADLTEWCKQVTP
jgi:uncharacterized protein YeaO (DUF488 family)